MEENRLASGGICEPVQESLEEHIAHLAQQIEKTRSRIKDHVDHNSDQSADQGTGSEIISLGQKQDAHYRSRREETAASGLWRAEKREAF